MPSLKYVTDDNCRAGVKPACQCNLVTEEVYLKRRPPKCIKVFDEIENAGTEISYRCVDCRNCPECKKCPRLDSLSIQEEVEQKIIDCSVEVEIEQGITSTALPFVVSNPDGPQWKEYVKNL